MKDLIEALTIIEGYDSNASTHCEHDVMAICGVYPHEVALEDKLRLQDLGFHIGDSCGEEAFESYRWGSC